MSTGDKKPMGDGANDAPSFPQAGGDCACCKAANQRVYIPPPPSEVDLGALLRDGLAQVMLRADAEQLMTYHLGGGSEADRSAAAAQWLLPVLGPVDPALLTTAPGASRRLPA